MKIEARIKDQGTMPPDSRVVLDHAQLSGQDYSGLKLMQFCTIASRLDCCRFLNTSIEDVQFGSGLEMSEFVGCTFDGARLVGLGGRSRFIGCSFRDINGSHWMFNKAELIDCTFSGRLTRAIFSGTVPQQFRAELGREHNECCGNDFSGIEMIDVTFRAGIDLSRQRLPSAPQYLYLTDARVSVDRARSRVEAWEEFAARKTALNTLNALADEVNAGQRQLLLRPDEWLGRGGLDRIAAERLFALLRERAD